MSKSKSDSINHDRTISISNSSILLIRQVIKPTELNLYKGMLRESICRLEGPKTQKLKLILLI